ncbi:retinol dehydrogenase 12-like isoform X2 [Leptopilina boulardi]|uniref:retinol dehydrogenase 12-like isoform X2 n=1 Tax=Leptopilina boulardi TaxID=63433 RepID=UPI0021F5AD2F|nr:retinol dehydrogenase 12-like isoform X2 [Leptopilina boulardi]XP_051164544.1 retinol dehydrogenase 12-like isoform X2 [Leptopilina boulardi]XP_051164545.1 retinol dehydrogenase 12-like isoform X2 [Leptopilina boulardi]
MEYNTYYQILTYICYFFLIFIILKLLNIVTKGKCKIPKRLDGQVIIITGSSRGIGKCTALNLAKRGAKIIIACNDITEANEARDEIIQASGNKNIEAHFLDLSSFDSVRKFVKNIYATEKRLDVLINNAGIAVNSNKKTEDGLELGLQVNHYGHFLLTNLLIDLLKKSTPSRIIHVSSLLHLLGRLDFQNMNSEKGHNWLTLYSDSKLYNVLGSNQFAERLEGTGVTSNCVYPGWVKTNLFEQIFLPARILIVSLATLLFKTPEEGAQTSIHLTVSDEGSKVSGKYFVDCKNMNFFNRPYSNEDKQMFWNKCCDLVGLKPEEKLI